MGALCSTLEELRKGADSLRARPEAVFVVLPSAGGAPCLEEKYDDLSVAV